MAILRQIPPDHKQRLQHLLDEADTAWFERNPGEQYRIRMHFRGEQMDEDAGIPPSRSIVVTMEAGRLIRRYQREEAAQR